MNPDETTPTQPAVTPSAAPAQPSAPDLNTNAQVLTNAIRLNEGGNNYDASGDSGASWGAYQFGKGAWAAASKLAGITSAWGQADPADQNAAADAQVKHWLSQGLTPPQIASSWNAGPGAPDAYQGTFPNGTPSVGYNPTDKVNYDVPSYTKNVLNTASRLYSGLNTPQPTPSAPQAPTALAGGDLTQTGGKTSGSGTTGGLVSGALALGGGLLAGGAGLLKGISGSFPAIGAVAGEALAPEGGPISAAAGAGVGEALQGAVGGNTPEQAPAQTQQPSATYSALQDALSQTIGGNQVMQEGEARGVDPITTLEESGAVPQPDENGNYDKVTPTQTLNDQIKQDKQFQTQALSVMQTPSSLNEIEKETLAEADARMQGSPDLTDTKNKIRKTFQNYRDQQPKEKDQYGNEYTKTFHVTPAQLQQMKERSSEGSDWSTPHHEREASQHIYKTMGKHLSAIAKKEGIKGWDETNKRMEARILAIKAIKKLPKKATRDKKKEFRREIASALAGAAIGKTFGHGLLGGAIGDVVGRRLTRKHYKKIGTSEERKEGEKRAQQKQKGLISLNATPKS